MSEWKDYLAGRLQPHPEQTPEQHAYQMKVYAEHEADWRLLSNTFQLWSTCEHKECRRAKACTGDPAECGMKFCRSLTPDAKFWLGKVLGARAKGLSPPEAFRTADAALAELAARTALPASRGSFTRAQEP